MMEIILLVMAMSNNMSANMNAPQDTPSMLFVPGFKTMEDCEFVGKRFQSMGRYPTIINWQCFRREVNK